MKFKIIVLLLCFFVISKSSLGQKRIFYFHEMKPKLIVFFNKKNHKYYFIPKDNLNLIYPKYHRVVCRYNKSIREELLKSGAARLQIYYKAPKGERDAFDYAETHKKGKPIAPLTRKEFYKFGSHLNREIKSLFDSIKKQDSLFYSKTIDSLNKKILDESLKHQKQIDSLKNEYNKIYNLTGDQKYWLTILVPTIVGLYGLIYMIIQFKKK